MSSIAVNEEYSNEFRQTREDWLATVDLPDKTERLFELETTLKALDRFFNLDNLPIVSSDQVISRDFSIEMRIIAKACRDVARLARILLKEEASAFTFRSYIENQVLNDRARDAFNAQHVAQETPSESLYVLGASFQNLADTTQALTRLNGVSYPLFVSIGQMVSRAIADNRFFNPIAGDHFDPAHDKMKNQTVAQVVRDIEAKDLRKDLSIALLAFFRLMRYLDMVDSEADKRDELRQALLVLSLVHSESRMLAHFLEREMPERLAGSRTVQTVALVEVADSIAFQFNMELRKVYRQALREVFGTGSLARVRSAVSSAVGILFNFFEQSVVALVQTFDPGVRGPTVFPGFVSKVEQSARLREDIWVLNKVCDFVEQRLSKEHVSAEEFQSVLSPLMQFVDYFMGLSFKFVRYSDHDEMERFFTFIRAVGPEAADNPHKLADFRKKIGYFNRFVETTLGHIRHREELQELPLDTDHSRRLLDQFTN